MMIIQTIQHATMIQREEWVTI